MLQPIGQDGMAWLFLAQGSFGLAQLLDAVQMLLDNAGREKESPAWRDLQHILVSQGLEDCRGLEKVISFLQQHASQHSACRSKGVVAVTGDLLNPMIGRHACPDYMHTAMAEAESFVGRSCAASHR